MDNKQKRYKITLDYIQEFIPSRGKILDLGTPNELSEFIASYGYSVENTHGEDLDLEFAAVETDQYDAVTAFEIFEHMLAPYNILRKIKAKKLIASIPLNLWFAPAYWHPTNEWDRHYHEFEEKQFIWLLEKTGWNVVKKKKWAAPTGQIGFRPLLRFFFPRYLIVYCERVAQ